MQLLLLLPMAFLLSPAAQAGEIIGGKEADPHSRPYMAYLQRKEGTNYDGDCGGALIRDDVVITAAHCNIEVGDFYVLLGAHDVTKNEPEQQRIRVRRSIRHPKYYLWTLKNDIALLQLEEKAWLTKAVRTIPLAHEAVEKGSVCSMSGWGGTRAEENSTFSPVLQESDSGGPLVCDGEAQGILSFGHPVPPAIYTRVPYYLPWIEKTLRELDPQSRVWQRPG
uniref:Peptidase S1 domain-containing protein n=1 Tax=Sphenodon punctatus TaxID=8508 RepID=A0A8D0HFT1_SPHPU